MPCHHFVSFHSVPQPVHCHILVTLQQTMADFGGLTLTLSSTIIALFMIDISLPGLLCCLQITPGKEVGGQLV